MTSLTPDKDPWKPVFMTFFSVFVLPLTAAIWHARQNIWHEVSYFGLVQGMKMPWSQMADREKGWITITFDQIKHIVPSHLPAFVRRMVKGVIRVPRHTLLSSSSSSFYHPPPPSLPHHHRPHPPHHHGDNGKRVPTASGRYVQTMIWLNLTGAVLNTNLAVLTELCFDNNTPSVLYNIHCSDSVHLCTAQNWNRLQPNFTLLAC